MQLTGLGLWLTAAIFLAAAVVVWAAGTRLTGYLDTIATITGLDQAFTGMLLLGGITSLPEVAAVATASVAGDAPLATNNLLGSVSINVLLIAFADAVLGRAALTSTVPTSTTMLQGALGMIALALVAVAVLTGDVALGWVGLWPIILSAYCVCAFWLSSRYARRPPWHARDANPEGQGGDADRSAHPSLRSLVMRTSLAAAFILVAGFLLARAGEAIAVETGLGSGLVGLVLVGFATSLPEVSSITAAVRRKRYEMALGDVFGTNLLTIGLLVLSDALYLKGPVLREAGRFEAIASLIGVLLTGIFLVGLIERQSKTVLRMGYDAVLAIVVFAGGLVILYFNQGS
ncbi:sodium:calcium antiporter [Chelatococcus sp. GCM10030263]|uniref:sodium:calcium antiporter n=1 Tax=Chelatococcus sp. GCM10030263 TaxID=3273387 RepID=UPI00361E9486